MHLKNPAGVFFVNGLNYLDHLGPLCANLNIPLVISDICAEEKALQYYPDLKIIYQEYFSLIKYVVKHFDTIITCFPCDLLDTSFLLMEKTMNKSLHKVWCPHGNSDKGHKTQMMEQLANDQYILTYGQKMIDFIQEKAGKKSSMFFFQLGNYRLDYYRKHETFYDKILKSRFPQNNNLNILYCPSWKDSENSSSFFHAIDLLIKGLQNDMNLLIKVHPNIELLQLGDLELIIQKYKGSSNIYFIHDIPTIYPILDRIDVYLGDLSSVNYDCLAFDIPMFFIKDPERDLAVDRGLYSYQFGQVIDIKEIPNFFQIIQKNSEEKNQKIKQSTYEYTFGKIDIPSYRDLFISSQSSDVLGGNTNTVCKS